MAVLTVLPATGRAAEEILQAKNPLSQLVGRQLRVVRHVGVVVIEGARFEKYEVAIEGSRPEKKIRLVYPLGTKFEVGTLIAVAHRGECETSSTKECLQSAANRAVVH